MQVRGIFSVGEVENRLPLHRIALTMYNAYFVEPRVERCECITAAGDGVKVNDTHRQQR
ncbi:MAG: hypothetical protein ACE1ZA_02670 [Pseudomonadales bacterium]